MKISNILVTCVIGSSMLMGASLVDKAKKNGLIAIPQSQLQLLKLIDNPKDPITPLKVDLGKKFYFDTRLSKSGLISCNTCHNLGLGGVDGLSEARGNKWTPNPHHLNSPTVYNSVFFASQFWDGRSPNLADQAMGPTRAMPEMAASPKHIEEVVKSMPQYVKEFKMAYGQNAKITFKKITSTIAIFEKTLVTPSRFDDYLNGDMNALTKAEKEGLNTFIDKGCASCHTGIALGGTMKPFQLVGKYKFANVGDFKGDKNGMVKTPTLRNITETAPYFHNGEVWSLKDTIKMMGSIQLGIKINDTDANKIDTFLKALKGKKPMITYPQLPESNAKTPEPVD